MLHPPSNPAQLLEHWRHLLDVYGLPLLATAVGVLAAGLVAVRVVRARRNRALADGAQLIEISAPPEAEATGGEALWANLLGLHRPLLTRWLRGQEHVAFEYAATGDGVSIRMWIPERVAPGLVEQAVEAAWPGARTTLLENDMSPIPSGDLAIEGGRLVPARSSAVPLRMRFETDPLRPLLGAFAALGHAEAGCVQIVARPASARRVRRLRRSLPDLSGRPGSRPFTLGRVLADFVPGPTPKKVIRI